MSNQEAATASGTAVVVDDASFLNDRIDLTRLRLALKRNSDAALKAMVDILTSVTSSENLKFQAAKAILDLQVQVAATISKDQIQRLVAELKLKPNGRTPLIGSGGDEEEDDGPVVDFHTVRQVG